MDEFERMTVELQIGMRREDNEELFNSVYSQLFGHNPENDVDTDFGFDDDTDEDENFDFDNDKNAEEAFDYDNGIDADYEDF